MGKAIAFLFFLVVCSFTFVTAHLMLRRPASVSAAPRVTAAALQTREDGSVYAVSLELEKFERRLMEEERRSEKLMTELEALREEREELTGQVQGLQAEVRRLRRQVNGQPRPAAPVEVPGLDGEDSAAPVTSPQLPTGTPATGGNG